MLCIVRIAHKCMQDLVASQLEYLVRLAAQSVALTMTFQEHVVQVARLCAANSDVHETLLGVLADWDHC